MSSDTIKPILRTTLNTLSLTSSYQPINSNGIEEACVNLFLFNDSDFNVDISYDGIHDHDVCPPATLKDLSFQAQSVPSNKKALWKKGTIVYVKGTAVAGTLYLSGYYV